MASTTSSTPIQGNKPSPLKQSNTTTGPIPRKSESDNAVAIVNEETARAIEKLEAKQKAINSNNVARVANSQLTDHAEKLIPLVSLKNGKAIERFPGTPKDITKLSLMDLNNILTALDAERTGSEAARRERLRLLIGLKPTPA